MYEVIFILFFRVWMSFNLREEIKDEFMSPNCSRKVYFGDLLRLGARKLGGPVTFKPNMFFRDRNKSFRAK